MNDTLWGPINPEHWKEIYYMIDKLATEKDVKEGRATFFLENLDEIPARPSDIKIPVLAIWTVEDEMENQPVVIIQANRVIFNVPLVFVSFQEATECVYSKTLN